MHGKKGGSLSVPVKVEWGHPCLIPLSGLLYTLAIESLLCMEIARATVSWETN